MSNRQMEENTDAEQAIYISGKLGITVDELDETNWEIESHEGNDGATYGHYIKFSNDSSKEVLDKIVGLENNCVNISFPDEPDEDYFDSNDDGHGLLMPDEIDLPLKIMPDLAAEERRKRDEGK